MLGLEGEQADGSFPSTFSRAERSFLVPCDDRRRDKKTTGRGGGKEGASETGRDAVTLSPIAKTSVVLPCAFCAWVVSVAPSGNVIGSSYAAEWSRKERTRGRKRRRTQGRRAWRAGQARFCPEYCYATVYGVNTVFSTLQSISTEYCVLQSNNTRKILSRQPLKDWTWARPGQARP